MVFTRVQYVVFMKHKFELRNTNLSFEIQILIIFITDDVSPRKFVIQNTNLCFKTQIQKPDEYSGWLKDKYPVQKDKYQVIKTNLCFKTQICDSETQICVFLYGTIKHSAPSGDICWENNKFIFND